MDWSVPWVPMWIPTTMPVSSHAAHSGSHSWWFRSSRFGRLSGRDADAVQADLRRVAHLGHRVVDVEHRHERRRHEPVGSDALDLRHHPLVLGPGGGGDELGVLDQRRPHPDRRVDDLAPDALVVEIDEPLATSRCPGRPGRHLDDRLTGLAVPHRLDLGDLPREGLPVDLDELLALVQPRRAGHPLGQVPAGRIRGQRSSGSMKCESPEWVHSLSAMSETYAVSPSSRRSAAPAER